MIKYKLLSFFTHPLYYLKYRGMVLLSSIRGKKDNVFCPQGSIVSKSTIRFSGKEHTVRLDGCHLYNCDILIRGNGNSLVIDKDVKVFNMRMKISGRGNIIHIGKGSCFGGGNIICAGKSTQIAIGEACMLAEGVDIWNTDTHSVIQNGQIINAPQSITIGNRVWTGKDVAILKGVTIGEGAVIGMRAVVTHDLEPHSLNAGCPAVKIRENVSWSND